VGRIIDTHAHVLPLSWKVSGLFQHPAVAPAETDPPMQRMEGATLPDLLADMDRAQVMTSLVVLREATGEFLRLAAQHPGRIFGLAYYDSLSPHLGLEQVRDLCGSHPGLILGVTTMFPFRQDPRLTDFIPLYEYCAQRGLPLQFHMGGDPTGEEAGRPMALAVLARTYPRLRIVRLQAGADSDGEMSGLLHRVPNLFLQVEALQDAEAEGDGEARTLQRLLCTTDSRKLLFGSHWRGREAKYLQRVEAVRRLPWWQRRNVGWRTAVRVYGPRILDKRSG
jgi:predicted TIM-barrel fold metal-dependent hydrolase